MVKRHLKRLAMPKSWQINRKEVTFVTRPKPGSHPMRFGIPLTVVFRDILHLTKTTRETKKMMQDNDILVDKVRRKDARLIIGLMDTLSIPAIQKYYRVILNSKGKLNVIEIGEKEVNVKPCKIIGKTMIKGICQINLFDGKNVIVKKNSYRVGDSVLLDLAKKDVKDHLKLEKGSTIILVGGKNVGHVGKVDKIEGNKVLYKGKRGAFETLKKYVFVIGAEKAIITLGKNE